MTAFWENIHYISNESNFVHSPNFENGIVKVLSEKCDVLLPEERTLLNPFVRTDESATISPTKPKSLSAQALNRVKRRKVVSEYVSLDHIPPTSNTIERLFRAARLILTDNRKSVDPYTFQCLLFLKVDRKKWDINLLT